MFEKEFGPAERTEPNLLSQVRAPFLAINRRRGIAFQAGFMISNQDTHVTSSRACPRSRTAILKFRPPSSLDYRTTPRVPANNKGSKLKLIYFILESKQCPERLSEATAA